MFPTQLGFYSNQHTNQTRDLHTPPCVDENMNSAPLFSLQLPPWKGELLHPQKKCHAHVTCNTCKLGCCVGASVDSNCLTLICRKASSCLDHPTINGGILIQRHPNQECTIVKFITKALHTIQIMLTTPCSHLAQLARQHQAHDSQSLSNKPIAKGTHNEAR